MFASLALCLFLLASSGCQARPSASDGTGEGPPVVHVNLHHSFKELGHAASQTVRDVYGYVKEKASTAAQKGKRVLDRTFATVIAPAAYLQKQFKDAFRPRPSPLPAAEPTPTNPEPTQSQEPSPQNQPTLHSQEPAQHPGMEDERPNNPSPGSPPLVSEQRPKSGKGQSEKQPEAGKGQSEQRPEVGKGQSEQQPEAGKGQGEQRPEVGNGQSQQQPEAGKGQGEQQPEVGKGQSGQQPDAGKGGNEQQPGAENAPNGQEQNGQHPVAAATSTSEGIVFADEDPIEDSQSETKEGENSLDIRFGENTPHSSSPPEQLNEVVDVV